MVDWSTSELSTTFKSLKTIATEMDGRSLGAKGAHGFAITEIARPMEDEVEP